MSYREEDGQVVLTMSREDYDALMRTLAWQPKAAVDRNLVTLLNRLNEGNPNYTPYQVKP